MARFTLSSYTVRLRDKYSHKYLRLDQFGSNHDLLSIFDQYLQDRKAQYSVNATNQKLLGVLQSDLQSRMISGLVETGEYGYEADLYDIQAASVSYQRTANDAEMVPFYFLVNLPAQRDEGVLILQRMAQYGIRMAFLQDFSQYLKGFDPTIQVEINPLVPQNLIDNYLQNGRLTKVRFIRFGIPPDVADAFEGGGHAEESGHTELVVSAGRSQRLPLIGRIRDALNNNKGVNKMLELHEFDYDTVKIELELAGRRRIVDLSNIMKLRAYYDLPSELEVGANGHPVFTSIDSIAQDLIGGLLDTLGTGNAYVG